MSYISEERIDLTTDDDNVTDTGPESSIKTYSIVTSASSVSTATATVTEAANNITLTASASNASVTPSIFTKKAARILKQVAGTVEKEVAPNVKVSKSKILITSTPNKRVDIAPGTPVVTSTPEVATKSSW